MTPTHTINPDDFNQSTGLSWFWALLFNWVWFLWHGFYKQAAIIFVLNFVFIGIIMAPFMAYPAWREQAEADAKAERTIRALEGRG